MDRKITLLPGNIVYGGDNHGTHADSFRSLGHLLLERLKDLDNTVLLINGETGDKYTAKYIYNSVVRMAYILRELGVGENDAVALCVENSIEFAIAFYATHALNAIISPMNYTYTEGELAHTLGLIKPKIIFATSQAVRRVLKVSSKMSFVKAIISTGDEVNLPEVYSFHGLMKARQILSQADIYVPQADKNKVAIVFYSSGTTGLAKGVELTQRNIQSMVNLQFAAITSAELNMSLSVVPWAHVYGGNTLLYAVTMGKAVIFFKRYHPTILLKAIEQFRVTHCFLVPSVVVFLSKDPMVNSYDLSSLKWILCGAGVLKAETIERLQKRFNKILLTQGYGMTETTCGVIVQDPLMNKLGSIGRPQKGVYVKIIDQETGEALGFNKLGELCIKSNLVMKGYIRNEKATKETIKDEWIHTGDIAYYDKDFNFFIEDRMKELIKYKANQVAPAELEFILLNHNAIIDAAVVGKPDEECGELPTAFVVKDPKANITETDIVKYVAQRVSPAKHLRGGVIFVDAIPKTFSGKTIKRELKAKYFIKSKL